MRKKYLLMIAALMSALCCSPALAQDTNTYHNYEEEARNVLPENLSEDFARIILNCADTETKYSNASNVNVRKEPNTNSEVLDRLMVNTSVDVICEYEGWSCIATCDGIAFVSSQYLSDEELTSVPLGKFKITHYCTESHKHICGTGTGLTTMETEVRPGIISVDPRIIPLGSKVMINGQIYSAEDTGGRIKGNIIDMAVTTHKEALKLGTYYADVYLVLD